MGDDLRALMIVVPLALLGACGGKPPAAQAPAPAAPGALSDFSKPIDVRGTEPFWNLTIRGGTLTLTRPDQPAVVGTAPGAVIQPSEARWTGKTAEGAELTVALYASPCSDGTSDHSYPWSAEVELAGQSPLNGCADQTAALARTRKP